MTICNLKLRRMPASYTVATLPPGRAVTPPRINTDELWSLTMSAVESSIVCADARAADLPPDARIEPGWASFALQGPIPFTVSGIIARLTSALAADGIGCFVVSTYDSDFFLIKTDDAVRAIAAWRAAGASIAYN